MPTFHFQFNGGNRTISKELGVEFANLEEAYLDVCAAIPDIARDLLVKRQDPLAASCTIIDAKGRTLMTVPFTDVLSPVDWRQAKARLRPHGGLRSTQAREQLALSSFRRMFGLVNAGCVLMTADMLIIEMNEFGARHSCVDVEAIRGRSIFEIFDLHGKAKADFDRFMSLPQAGVVSEIVDMPYLVQDADGQTVKGWWKARTWPIFDDDDRVLGFVEWAEPHTMTTNQGKTEIRTTQLKTSPPA